MKWGHPSPIKVIWLAGDLTLAIVLLAFAGPLSAAATTVISAVSGLSQWLASAPGWQNVHWPIGVFFALASVSLLYIFDLYDAAILMRRDAQLLRFGLVLVCSTAFVAVLVNVSRAAEAASRELLFVAVVFPALAVLWRALSVRLQVKLPAALTRRALILGSGQKADVLRSILESGEARYVFAGQISMKSGAAPVGAAVATDLESMVQAYDVSCIIVAHDHLGSVAERGLTRLRFQGLSVFDAAKFAMCSTERLPLDLLSDSWFWFAEGFDMVQFRVLRRLKRLADIVLSLTGLALTAPLWVVVPLLVRLEASGPVIFRQTRVGWKERPFSVLKFRTMHTDAEQNGPQWAQSDDRRITRVGFWLRKLHLDEIPQMVNVLRGEMSFIGPRPERPEFVEHLKEQIPFYHLRHYVLPGITGWAQVKYPYGASVEDTARKLEYDLYYIMNGSPVLDLRILLKTVQVCLFQRGSR